MSTPAPDAVRGPVDRFDQKRKVFLSPDYKEEQLRLEFLNPRSGAAHERIVLNSYRVSSPAPPAPSAVSRKPMALPDALVYELYGLTEDEVRVMEGEGN